MASIFHRFSSSAGNKATATSSAHDIGINTDAAANGSLKYVAVTGDNTADTFYQHAASAPVETISPLGHNVGPITIIFMNVGKMVGTGIYSTRTRTNPPEQQRLLTLTSQLPTSSVKRDRSG
jgi:hypothetical protein